MRQIFRRIPLPACRSRSVPVDRIAGARPIFRPEQGSIQRLQVRGAQDRALRHLFLRRRARRARRASAAWPSAGTRASRRVFEHEMRTRQPLVLYASHPDFEQTNVVGGMIGEGTGGVTEGLKRRVVLPLAGTLAETDHVLGHELVHAFQYDISAQRRGGRRRRRRHRSASAVVRRRAGRIPVDRACRSAHGDVAARRDAQGKAAADQGPRQRQSSSRTAGARPCGRTSAASTATTCIGQIFRDALRSGSPIVALKHGARSSTTRSCRPNWHAAIREQYAPMMARDRARAHVRARAHRRTTKRRWRRTSRRRSAPTGAHIVYFSSRDLFSIDLYLADAATGRIVRKLVDTALNSHFTQPAVHRLGRLVEARQPPVRRRRRARRQGRARDPRRRQRRRRARDRSAGGRRDPESRRGRPTASRSRSRQPSAATPICSSTTSRRASAKRITSDLYRRSAAGVVSGRRAASRLSPIGSRPTPTAAERRRLPAGAPRRRVRAASRRSRRSRRARTSTRSGTRTAGTCYFVSDQNGISNVYRSTSQSGALAQITNVDSGVSGITGAEPGDLRRRSTRGRWRSARTRTAAITSTSSTRRSSSPARRSTSTATRLQAASLPPVAARVDDRAHPERSVNRPASRGRQRSSRTRRASRSMRSASRTSRPASIGSAAWSAAASRSTSATCSAITICTRRSAPTPTAAAARTSRRTRARLSPTRI